VLLRCAKTRKKGRGGLISIEIKEKAKN
jgi:hypothetical protein